MQSRKGQFSTLSEIPVTKGVEWQYQPDTVQSAGLKPRSSNSNLITLSPMKRHDRETMTQQDLPKNESSSTVLDLCFAFQSTLGAKFTEMLQVHREIMFEMMSKERSRDGQFIKLTAGLRDLHIHRAKLQAENSQLCEILARQRD